MINHRRRYIFVHIPKTAGNSVKAVIKLDGHEHQPLSVSISKLRGCRPPQAYFKFAFVRNPWDRFVSSYFYIKKGGWTQNGASWDLHQRKSLRMLKFSGFKDFALNCNKKKLLECKHFQHQSLFIDRPIDFIGRTETLQSDVDFVCDMVGLPCGKLPVRNATGHKPYASYYDDETIEAVAQIYAKDIASFGYTFDGFSPKEVQL